MILGNSAQRITSLQEELPEGPLTHLLEHRVKPSWLSTKIYISYEVNDVCIHQQIVIYVYTHVDPPLRDMKMFWKIEFITSNDVLKEV